MNRQGMLYGVGMGPGDPDLLTLAAVKAMERCGVIAAPDSGSGDRVALDIAGERIAGKQLLLLPMPMTRDREAADRCHGEGADRICALLDRGEDVAFLTLGDPTVYSTYLYLHKRVLSRGYRAAIIPGVPSFCAAAAALNTGLCEGGQPLHIIPGSYGGAEEALDLPGVKVLMKSGGKGAALRETLEARGLLERTSLVERCSMPGQRVVERLSPGEEPGGYFTIYIVKD